MAASAFFMFRASGRYPISLCSLEGPCGLSARGVLAGDRQVISDLWAKPIVNIRGGTAGSGGCITNPFLIYPIAWLVGRFGCGDDYLALRLPSMIYGCLSVLVLYLLVARMFNRTSGLIAAWLLAVSSWAIGYSRFCGEFSATVLFALLCFCLYHLLNPDRRLGYLALGGMISLATYFYGTVRMVFPVIASALLLDLALVRKLLRARLENLVFLLCGLVIGLHLQGGGLATYFRQNLAWDWSEYAGPGEMAARFAGTARKAYDQLFRTWGWGEEDGIILERAAVLDPVTRVAFLLGLLWALTRLGRPAHRFLILWLVPAILPPLITHGELRRGFLALPAFCALAGVGLEETTRLAFGRLPRARAALTAAVVIPALALAAYLNYDNYFGLYQRLGPDHPLLVRKEQRAALVDLLRRTRVYTDLFRCETGWDEGVRFDEYRLGRPGAVAILPPEEAAAAFARDSGPCALYLSDGTREEK